MEITNLGQADGLPPVDWAAVVEKLAAGSAPAPDAANSRTTWLSSVNEDGSPHVTAVGALWLDGTFWFQTGAGTRKGRNVARDPRCSIAVSIRDADVVIEGDATRVTEPGALANVLRHYIVPDDAPVARPIEERLAGRTRAELTSLAGQRLLLRQEGGSFYLNDHRLLENPVRAGRNLVYGIAGALDPALAERSRVAVR